MSNISETAINKTFKRNESVISSLPNVSSMKEKDSNNESDCESIISEREGLNKEKKVKMDVILKAKNGGKSILNIAKDLKKNISV